MKLVDLLNIIDEDKLILINNVLYERMFLGTKEDIGEGLLNKNIVKIYPNSNGWQVVIIKD